MSKMPETKTPKPKKSKSAEAKRRIRRVRVDAIKVDESKFRDLNEKKLSDLAASIEKLGLLHHPTVSIKKQTEDGGGDEKFDLHAGRHRLEAAKRLDWKFIDVVVVKRNKKKNRMRQITENLHRNDLTASERAELVNEWVKLCEEEGRGVAHPQPHDKGISRAARTLGMSNKSVRNSRKVANIDPDARKALKQAGLNDNEEVMLEVAGEEPEDQVAKVQEIVERREKEKARPKGKAKPKKTKAKLKKTKAKGKYASDDNETDDDHEDDSDTAFGKLKEVWGNSPDFQEAWADAGAGDRQRFVDEVLFADGDGDDDDEWKEDEGGRGMTAH